MRRLQTRQSLSHSLKLFLKVIHQIIFFLCEITIIWIQTKKIQNCYIHRKVAGLCFTLEVQDRKLVNILKRMNIDQKVIPYVDNLYWNQTAGIKIGSEPSNPIKIYREVSDWSMSCHRFYLSLFSEHLSFRKHWKMLKWERTKSVVRMTLLTFNNF